MPVTKADVTNWLAGSWRGTDMRVAKSDWIREEFSAQFLCQQAGADWHYVHEEIDPNDPKTVILWFFRKTI